ncbi:MAG: TIM barrel protein [Pirellulaceae bacterium]
MEVTLSGFCDEVCESKNIDEQFGVFSALGMSYVTLRFLDVGNGIKNVMQLTGNELDLVRRKLDYYGISVSSLGSPIGKVKLLDFDDGTANAFRPFDEYLESEVKHAATLAKTLDTKLVRGFSFYHPRGTAADEYLDLVSDRLKAIAEVFDSEGLTFGLEVEANLVGHTGEILAELSRRAAHPALVLIFDGGNLVTQGFDTDSIFSQWQVMRDGLGWLHVKDYAADRMDKVRDGATAGWVDEEKLDRFVPVELGDSGYERVFSDLKANHRDLMARLNRRGVDQIFVDLEPHLRQGGQFGGFSGPDGFGIALRSLCQMLDRVGISYRLREFESM